MNSRNALSILRSSMKKQWFGIAVFALMAFLALILMTGVTMFTNRVYITDGEQVRCILTTDEKLEDILKENEYTIGADDAVEFDGFKDNVGNILILRAFDVSVTSDGQARSISIAKGTVSDVLAKAGIAVGDDDLMNIGLAEPVQAGTQIVIQRVVYEDVTTQSAIPFETTQKFSANYAKGTQIVSVEGQEGVLETITRHTYIDGKLSASQVVSEAVAQEPVGQVVTVGTSYRAPVSTIAPETLVLDEKGAPVSYTKVLTGKSAAYSAKPGAKTASGRTAQVGYVAVDPKIIPYGTKLYIASTNGKRVYGYAVAADTGTALLDGRIMVDLFFDSYQASCNWGIQQVNIYILE